MCLESKAADVRKFLARHKKQRRKTVICYKVLIHSNPVFTNNRILWSPYQGTKWETSTLRDNFGLVKPQTKKNCDVTYGIHVYLTKSGAGKWDCPNYVIVRVRCQLSNLIGVNLENSHAVFSEATIIPEDWEKHTKKGA